jgi:hypothetical protein
LNGYTRDVCIYIDVHAEGIAEAALAAAREGFARHATLEDGVLDLRGGVLMIHACDLFDEDADRGGETYAFSEIGAAAIESALAAALPLIPRPIRVSAAWDGDAPLRQEVVNADRLLQLVREGLLGSRIEYMIGDAIAE